MSDATIRGTLLNIPMIRERTAFSFCASLAAHGIAFLLVLWGGYFLPSAAVRIGGPGGGSGGEAYAVGVVDDLSGGAGMVKPSIEPKPPALLDERPVPDKATAVPIPQSVEPRKPKISERERREAEKLKESKSNVIPTAAEAGSGGAGGAGGGGGGGRGGGIGVSIGAGSGGLGDSWYARAVEGRISSNWIQPPKGVTCEMVYSFFIAPDGTIFGIKKEKTSGNPELDLTAERAIRASNPLAPPPPEFRGRPVQFIAYFQYPPPP